MSGLGTDDHVTVRRKLVLLGESNVGKTSMIISFVRGEFMEVTESTIGAAFLTQEVDLGDLTVRFDVWFVHLPFGGCLTSLDRDTAGQERYKSLAPMYYRGAHAAVVVYDITSEDSFEKAKIWVEELRQAGPDSIVMALSGNKSDLARSRCVQPMDAQRFADENELLFMETSAKTGQNIQQIFQAIAKRLPTEDGTGTIGEGFAEGKVPPELSWNTKKKKRCGCA